MLAAAARACFVALVALGVACSRTRAPNERLASRPPTELSSRAKRPANPDAGQKPLETPPPREPRLDEGCTAGIEPSPHLVGSLHELERQCVWSMRPLIETPAVVELAAGASAGVAFALTDPTGCVRAAAALEPGLAEMEIGIVDPAGGSHAVRTVRGPFALLEPDGPVCFDRAGSYRVELTARRGSGRAAIGVWTARSPRHATEQTRH